MNRRRTITIAGTVGAVAGFMGVVYGTANWATSQREGPGSPAGPNPAQALRAGRAPIPEVAVAPGIGSGPAPVVPPFPRFTGAPEEDETGATTTVRSGDVQAILDRMPLAPSLPAAERDGLIWMREEERLAHDVYFALARRWGNGPFSNIGAAEATHSEAVRLLIDRYGVADPASGTVVGNYGNPIFSRLYQELVTTGSASYVDGLKVGARIEELDIRDLEARESTLPDIASVYAELERGSRNHLRAFVRQIERHGAQYAPMYLTIEAYDAIIGSGHEGGPSR
ncbi:MAG: DUF2202 domain-containing protein [Chloroflexi bacterium]|nr:DUF2202 domain-containing protein [Chloroflexota bacterium]